MEKSKTYQSRGDPEPPWQSIVLDGHTSKVCQGSQSPRSRCSVDYLQVAMIGNWGISLDGAEQLEAAAIENIPEVMNLDHGFLGYLPKMSSYCSSSSISYRSKLKKIHVSTSVTRRRNQADLLSEEFVGAQNLGDLDQLIVIVMTMEEAKGEMWV
jgi:hypothetical protein